MRTFLRGDVTGGSARPGPHGRSGSEPPRRWHFWALAYTYLVLLAGTNVPTPLYDGYQREFGFSTLVLTLVFASYVAAVIPSLLLAGPLSDAVGRKRVLVPAVALAVAGSALFAAAQGTSWLYLARCVQGVSVGAASGALVAAMSEMEPSGDRRRAALVATMAPVAGTAIGPLVSGLLAEYVAGPHVVPYLVEIALLAPALIAMARIPDRVTRSQYRPRRPQVPAAIRGTFTTSAASSFAAWAVTALFLALLPSYLADLTGTTNLAVAGGIVTVLLGCSTVAQRAGYAWPARGKQAAGLALLSLGLLVLIAAGSLASLVLLLVATVLAGTGQGLAFLGAMTQINRIAPSGRHADIVSSFLVATYLGNGLPVIGVGLASVSVGLLTAVRYFAGIVAVLCVGLLVASLRRGHPRPLGAPGAAREVDSGAATGGGHGMPVAASGTDRAVPEAVPAVCRALRRSPGAPS